MKLGQDRRGVYFGMHYVDPTRVEFTWSFRWPSHPRFLRKLRHLARLRPLDYEFASYGQSAELVRSTCCQRRGGRRLQRVNPSRQGVRVGPQIAEELKSDSGQLFEVVIQAASHQSDRARSSARCGRT